MGVLLRDSLWLQAPAAPYVAEFEVSAADAGKIAEYKITGAGAGKAEL